MRVAVVGAGIAGVACARQLAAAGHQVVVHDRGRVPGGRLASRRFHGRYVDLGASYLTAQDPAFLEVVQDWEARGLARPWTDTFAVWEDGSVRTSTGPLRWGAAGGLRSLVTDLAAGLDLRQEHDVRSVTTTSVDGEPYDVVVLAMPSPQAAALLGVELQTRWEPVLVLAARWETRAWAWDGLFVNGSDVLSWVADDGSRRGDGAPVLTAHSTPAFAGTRLDTPAEAAPEMVVALKHLQLPEPAEVLRVQRWTYAKPVGSRTELFGFSGGIGLCGDSFGAPKVETAWLSGRALAEHLSA